MVTFNIRANSPNAGLNQFIQLDVASPDRQKLWISVSPSYADGKLTTLVLHVGNGSANIGEYGYWGKTQSVSIGGNVIAWEKIQTTGYYGIFNEGSIHTIIINYVNGENALEAILMSNAAEKNKMDKTESLTRILYAIGTLRQGVDMTNPTIDVEVPVVENVFVSTLVNYVYLPQFKRYYFINSVATTMTANSALVRLSLHCDVLYSFKDSILDNVARIRRTNDPTFLLPPYVCYGDDEAIRGAPSTFKDYESDKDAFTSDIGTNFGFVIHVNSMGGM